MLEPAVTTAAPPAKKPWRGLPPPLTKRDERLVAKRSELNHIDPCFRFPYHDLQQLFDCATMIEGMLVALEHMQIYFISCSSSGLGRFHSNVISFPQDLSAFVARHGVG